MSSTISTSEARLILEMLAPLLAHFESFADTSERHEAWLDGAQISGFGNYPIDLYGLNVNALTEITYACGWLDAFSYARGMNLRELFSIVEKILGASCKDNSGSNPTTAD